MEEMASSIMEERASSIVNENNDVGFGSSPRAR